MVILQTISAKVQTLHQATASYVALITPHTASQDVRQIVWEMASASYSSPSRFKNTFNMASRTTLHGLDLTDQLIEPIIKPAIKNLVLLVECRGRPYSTCAEIGQQHHLKLRNHLHPAVAKLLLRRRIWRFLRPMPSRQCDGSTTS